MHHFHVLYSFDSLQRTRSRKNELEGHDLKVREIPLNYLKGGHDGAFGEFRLEISYCEVKWISNKANNVHFMCLNVDFRNGTMIAMKEQRVRSNVVLNQQ
jgi:hypothetical protein